MGLLPREWDQLQSQIAQEWDCGLCGGRSELVAKLLQRSGLTYTHLSASTPADYKLQPLQPHWKLPRGVMQRNAALAWLRSHLDTAPSSQHGVLYFADDDNTYDLRIFEEVCIPFCNGHVFTGQYH